jgi:CRISPR-associated protein Cas5t
MYIFTLRGYAETASFRVAESHTFHQSLPLPPRTTVVGLLGAAMGLEFMEAMAWVERNDILIGIKGKANGFMRDLWSFDKIKVDKGSVIKIKDVLTREFHASFSAVIALASLDGSALGTVQQAFQSPAFALTLGNSDDLLKVHRVTEITEVGERPCHCFEDVWLPGDLLESCQSDINLEAISPLEPVVAPRVFLLPDAFEIEGMKRNVARRRYYTHIGSRVRLTDPIPAVLVEGAAVPLLESNHNS